MMYIIKEFTERAIREAIHKWILLLADENYEGASEFLFHEKDYPWPPELLKEAITDYRAYENQVETTRITDPKYTHDGNEPRQDVTLSSFNPDYVAEAWYDLPVLGKWSDLTATFLFKKDLQGILFILEDLRVR